jgi:carbon-monoxide dehydrogenase large subunit
LAARRVEDRGLLLGLGRYSEDLVPEAALHAAFVRNPDGAADTDATRAILGIVIVIIDADLSDIASLPCFVRATCPRSPMPGPPWRALPTDTARHIGDAVARVVATPVTAPDIVIFDAPSAASAARR